jgi:hypothetical protein
MIKSESWGVIPASLLLGGVLLGVMGPIPTLQARDRLPLQKKKIEIGQPAPYAPELEGYDKKGNPVYWDPKPHVVPLGDGKYAFKWTGHSGRELTLIYQRPDLVDVAVEASAVAGGGGRLKYRYIVRNLKASKQNLGAFDVQTFSPAAQPETDPSTYATNPAYRRKDIPPEEGLGIYFAPLSGKRQIGPGAQALFVLTSPDSPGIVRCRAHGDTSMMKGVGEEPPSVLEDLFLGRDAWPQGYTIGPDERLAKMSLKERSSYLVQHLPQMLELGWMENQKVMAWYETSLRAGKAAEVRARAETDSKKNLITSEVLALMTYLTK